MTGNSDTLKKKVFEEWVKNPYTTAKKICVIHQFDYQQHGNYVNRLLSEFRSYTDLGLPQEPLRLEHRTFEWENIARVYGGFLGDKNDEMSFDVWQAGWRWSRNRNEMWFFNDDFGSVHWYKEGKVLLYLKGELKLAKVKELFCKAFSFMKQDQEFFRKYLDVPLREVYRKWIFEMGKPVPKFDIRTFERSHGLRIFTDLSHPTSVHVGEAKPFWLDEQRQANAELKGTIGEFGGVVQQFGVEIQEHLKLIKMWQEEATANRDTRSKEPGSVQKTASQCRVADSGSFAKEEQNDFMHEY